MPSNKTSINSAIEKTETAKRKTSFFLYLVCFYVVLDIGRIPELFPFLATIKLQKIIGGLAILNLFLNGTALSNLMQRVKTPQVKCILGLLVLSVFSIPFGVWPGNSLGFIIDTYWKIILAFFLILSSVNSIHDLGRMRWAFLIAIGFLTLFAVSSGAQGRVSASSAYDPNDITVVMVVALPLAVFGFIGQKGFKKIISGVLTLLILITIIGAASRGGFIALIAVSAVILIRVRKIERKIFLPLMVMFALGILVFFAYAGPQFWDRMSTILHPQEDYNISAPTGRIEVWKRGINMIIGNPFTGVGINNFTTAEGLSHQDIKGKWSTAHNSFLQIGGELGIPGLILFCYIIWVSLKRIRGIIKQIGPKKTDRDMFTTLIALNCAWIGYVVGCFFVSAAYSSLFYFLAGISAAISSSNLKINEKNLDGKSTNPLK